MRKSIKEKKYNYFYKITNLLNNHYYYGIHSTDNLDDGYMGSGKRLRYAYKKYGIENFTKEILKYFDTRKEAGNYEAEMVTEQLVKDNNCYNCTVGGDEINTCGMVSVYDTIEKINKVISQEEYHSNISKYVTPGNNKVAAINKITGVSCLVEKAEFYENRKIYDAITEGMITVKDDYNNFYHISINDSRYLSGKLKPIWTDRKHTEESKRKMRTTKQITGGQRGEKNSQFGTCWITNGEEDKKINKNDLNLFLENGWWKGRDVSSKNNIKNKIKNIDIDTSIEMHKNGMRWIDIAKFYGVSEGTFFKFKKRMKF